MGKSHRNPKARVIKPVDMDAVDGPERAAYLKKTFGLTLDAYKVLLESQNYGCKICGRTKEKNSNRNLAVDHCHRSGRIRGLLCNRCNTMLGLALDNINTLKMAIVYLESQNLLD